MNVSGESTPAAGHRRRAYHSPLREGQARQTRERIVRAAAKLFAERGYGSTTLQAIAEMAGVSAVLVQQNGPKSALLLAAVEHVSTGSEGFESFEELPQFTEFAEQVRNARDVLHLTARFAGESNRRVSRLWLALDRAADDDPEVAQRLDALVDRMRADARKAIDALSAFGGVRTDRTPDELADIYWSVGLPDLYHRLVNQAEWPDKAYVAWLEQTLAELLLVETASSE